ncbi:MBL fold metallo-hydrolase [Leifsonia sp. F6_8S_P_1B]|uniref:MBL fold metallo-hydrolase n=1 Tax=Leifsonia williamsii TaxID=3035919 RepID=A0ABT8K679_9MICO|nr:MBL fold metallo-hydrolase [Leifsonia williamsii]MDN4612941.1 MBL fold metallo-hydrolase [Leifsonia williamsii]
MTARRITDTVWAVGGSSGPERTSDHDGIQYLLWDGTDGLLIDVGTGLGADAWLANVGEVCADATPFGAFVSHYHADHAGGAAAAMHAGIDVYAGSVTAAALATADEQATSLERARRAGVYPEDYRLAAAPDVRILPDASALTIGSFTVTVLDAPGHCDGHLVFLVDHYGRRSLFSGDTLFSGGRVSIQAIPDCRLDLYSDTVRGLAELEVDELFPGHGEPVLADASVDIARAAESFRRLVPPPNILTA